MTCPQCQKAALNPLHGLYQDKCPGCEARAIEQSPACFAHVENMKRLSGRQARAEYLDGVTRSSGNVMAEAVKTKYLYWWENKRA